MRVGVLSVIAIARKKQKRTELSRLRSFGVLVGEVKSIFCFWIQSHFGSKLGIDRFVRDLEIQSVTQKTCRFFYDDS